MKKFKTLFTLALAFTLCIGIGAMPVQAYAGYTAYGTSTTTKPSYYTVGSYYISNSDAKAMANFMNLSTGRGSIAAGGALSVGMGLILKKAGGAICGGIVTLAALSASAQYQAQVVAAAENGHRVLVTIKDSTVHTSYSTVVTFKEEF